MAAYFILTHTITDTERYRKEYIPRVLPFLANTRAKSLWLNSRPNPSRGILRKGRW
jgi:hypothetical protein